MVERFHRQLKAAIKCYETEEWTQVLPVILLGIRAAWKEDVNSTPAEMLYGEPIRLPGQFLDSSSSPRQGEEDTLVTRLRKAMIRLQPTVKHHRQKDHLVFKKMETASHVFVRHDAPAGALHLLYDGPFEVLNRSDKTYKIRVRGKAVNISVDRLKPAYILDETPTHEMPKTDPEATSKTTRAGRTVRQPVRQIHSQIGPTLPQPGGSCGVLSYVGLRRNGVSAERLSARQPRRTN
ncbi:uncharacterized protein LOC105250140 [Camponotus floridanus]|uniref:uncharacterized protein LOC105250140 n=1 Tax=Camponotus floridanus TaxID=104421 RepID=UPI000DC67234|nr:uncharacterized protein LOC105250140 [Camponotus floridanus]